MISALFDRLAREQELVESIMLPRPAQWLSARIRHTRAPGSRAEGSETLSAGARAGLELLDPAPVSSDQGPGERVANA